MTGALAEPQTTTPPPKHIVEPQRWKFTRDDLIRLYELGFFKGNRVLLVDGEILAMSPMKAAHANGILFALQHIHAIFGANFTIRPQMPLDLGQTTDPEPDIAVINGPARSHTTTPTTAELVIEVADTSLAFDTGDKANLYASAGIADYWVVDVVNRRLHVFRDPRPDTTRRFGHGYFQQTLYGPNDSIAPLAAPSSSPILVSEMLP